MKKTKEILISLGFVLSLTTVFAQQKFTMSGYVKDAKTGEAMIGANVYAPALNLGTATNTYGFYSLTLPADSVKIGVSYIGYNTKYLSLLLNKDVEFNFALSDDTELEEIVVTAAQAERIEERSQMSTIEVPVQQIKQIPALLGEVDVLKALQLLPGVQSGGEGGSGLYVRGGSPDQNLILLDGVPVYNASHLFGFFSVFNADAIKNVTLTKGGYPARYGGRLSSVLEINMKEGNNETFHGEGSVGIIASRLTLEAPIKKGKTSFMVSGRRTYADVLARPFILAQTKGQGDGGYYFWDLNAKVNHIISNKDRVYVSMYGGKDRFFFKSKTKYDRNENTTEGGLDWGNLTTAARWNHVWNKKLFSNTTFTYSQYQFNIRAEDKNVYDNPNGNTETTEFSARYLSGINDWAGKIDFDYLPNPNHSIKTGISAIYHTFKPGATNVKSTGTGDEIDVTVGTENKYATEAYTYIEDDMSIGKKFKMNVGLHASTFAVDKKFYGSIQPRFGARYLATNNLALKASFALMTQYIHLLTNEGVGLPTDLWVPSTTNIKPEQSWQAAIGAARTIKKEYEVSVELYYKQMKNLVSYKEGSSFLGAASWENLVTQGKGDAYGAEFFIQKKTGKTTGWIGYTLAWSNRQFADINFGERYPFKYDRRHDFEIVASHKFNDRISINGTWVFSTGNAVSLPIASYSTIGGSNLGGGVYYNNIIDYYGKKNGFRMAAYHRLDAGIEFHKKKKRYERTWVLGVYNAYSRQNPFFIYKGNDNQGNDAFKQVSLFPIIPSVSYNFKF